MKASELHQITVDVLLEQALTKRVLELVTLRAKEGYFNVALDLEDDILEIQKVEQLLRDLGYHASVNASYQGKALHVRW